MSFNSPLFGILVGEQNGRDGGGGKLFLQARKSEPAVTFFKQLVMSFVRLETKRRSLAAKGQVSERPLFIAD